jgi:hypothetical protein
MPGGWISPSVGDIVNLRYFFALAAFAGAPLSWAGPWKAPESAAGAGLLGSLPGWFEPRQDAAGDVRYISRGQGAQALIDADGVRFSAGGREVRLKWAGGEASEVMGAEPKPSYSNYFVGDRAHWKSRVPHFGRVESRSVYAGVDIAYYWNGRQLEFDVVLAPGADPKAVRMQVEGGTPTVNTDGELILGDFRLKAPTAYQATAGERAEIAARYVVEPAGEVRFELGAYDGAKELVIDPILYTGYFGGDFIGIARGVAADPLGGVWVTGGAYSDAEIPSAPAPVQKLPKGQLDAFVAKLVPEAQGGMRLSHFTFWGGQFADEGMAVTTGQNNFVYIVGTTQSSDFPRFGTEIQPSFGGLQDAFITVLRPEAPDGQHLWFSSFLGDEGREVATSVSVDSSGFIYMGGWTDSAELPRVPETNVQPTNRGGVDGFIARIFTSSETPLQYLTFFGGDGTDIVTGVTADDLQGVIFTGYTTSPNFPVSFPEPVRDPQEVDGFVARLDTSILNLSSWTYGFSIRGNSLDIPTAIQLDGDRMWVSGYTTSTDFPTTAGAYQRQLAGASDGFLMAFDMTHPPPQPLVYSTYFGGSETEVFYGLAALPSGRVAAAGYTTSDDVPTKDDQEQPPLRAGQTDALVTLFDPDATGEESLVLSRVVGGSLMDYATGVAADADDVLYVAGTGLSRDMPVTDGVEKQTPDGASQNFLIRAIAPFPAERQTENIRRAWKRSRPTAR